jgi:hypothetical protein
MLGATARMEQVVVLTGSCVVFPSEEGPVFEFVVVSQKAIDRETDSQTDRHRRFSQKKRARCLRYKPPYAVVPRH